MPSNEAPYPQYDFVHDVGWGNLHCIIYGMHSRPANCTDKRQINFLPPLLQAFLHFLESASTFTLLTKEMTDLGNPVRICNHHLRCHK
jgi:hypothetical protein